MIATILNVALNFLLDSRLGRAWRGERHGRSLWPASILYYRKAQQLYYTPYLIRRALSALVVGCPLMAVGALPIEPEGLAVAVKLLAVGIFALAVWRLRLLDEEELHGLLALIRGARSRLPVSTAAS